MSSIMRVDLNLAPMRTLEQMAANIDRLYRPYPIEEKYFEGKTFKGQLYRADLISFIEKKEDHE